jgi:intracellular septation protein A
MKTNNIENQRRSSPLNDLIFSIAIPSFILMKLSGDDSLGATTALMVALAFPLGWGLFNIVYYKSFNFIALLGLISIALTGGIGLLKLDPQWLAIKEATIPALIGIAVLALARTRYSLVKLLIYNPSIMNVEKIKERLSSVGKQSHFDARLMVSTYWLAGTFLFSAVMNYVLAKWLVISPAGSEAFNEELAKMTMLSYPVIALPSTLAMFAIIYFLWKSIHDATGLEFEEILAVSDSNRGKNT